MYLFIHVSIMIGWIATSRSLDFDVSLLKELVFLQPLTTSVGNTSLADLLQSIFL